MASGYNCTLAPPSRVSPFIRFCRWGALTVGIIYGYRRYQFLAAREVGIRKEENRLKVISDEKNKLEKRRFERVELLALAKQVGVPVPADFDKQYPPV